MKISVIIPAFNEGKNIGECLKSILNQEVKPDEIIVVDNNSIDNTVKLAKSLGVKVVHEKAQGMIPARNRGFNEAQYEIIARTDADTRVPKDWIKQIKKAFEKDPKLVGYSGPATYYDVPPPLNNTPLVTQIYIEMVEQKALRHDSLLGPNMAIRKSAWEKVKDEVCLNDKDVHEDIDLAIHLKNVGKIKFDQTLIVAASGRRWRKLSSYSEQNYRTLKTIRRHKAIVAGAKRRGKHLVATVMKRRKNIIQQLRHLP